MINDPIPVLKVKLREFLRTRYSKEIVTEDGQLGAKVPWRPYVLEEKKVKGWHAHVALPESESWADRLTRAKNANRKLSIGVAAPEELFANDDFLNACDSLNASIIIFESRRDSFEIKEYYGTVADLIYMRRLKLSHACAQKILDRAYDRALKEKDPQRKGVLLELVVAVLLSQVDGFEVRSLDISNRSQEIDVLIHNRNVGGALGAGSAVLSEVKNWKASVGTAEYSHFFRKLETRHGRAKLGYFVTSGKFTKAVNAERRRDSKGETLVVLVDGETLTGLWRDGQSITKNLEDITLDSTIVE